MSTRATPLPEPKSALVDGDVALRWFKRADAPAIVQICRDPEIPRWTYMPEDLDVPRARAWIERRQQGRRFGITATFAVVDRDTAELVGQCGVGIDRQRNAGEAFYWVAAPARGRGVARTALGLVVGYAFETIALERIELKIDPANLASQAVARATGFTYEGTLRSDQPFKGRRMDSQIWSRLPDDTDGDVGGDGASAPGRRR
jgi:RimJ/RimL family protein N-acetyltransferase